MHYKLIEAYVTIQQQTTLNQPNKKGTDQNIIGKTLHYIII